MFFPKILHVVGVVIAKNSGAVTSMPNTNPIIFEVRRGSPLPELLAECGYDVIQVGITEVLTEQGTATKITRQHVGPATVAIYEFKLPFIRVSMRTARRRHVSAETRTV
jgi:hypothetical protein